MPLVGKKRLDYPFFLDLLTEEENHERRAKESIPKTIQQQKSVIRTRIPAVARDELRPCSSDHSTHAAID